MATTTYIHGVQNIVMGDIKYEYVYTNKPVRYYSRRISIETDEGRMDFTLFADSASHLGLQREAHHYDD